MYRKSIEKFHKNLTELELKELEKFEISLKKREQFFKDLIWWDIPFWIGWILFTWFYINPENIRIQIIINIEIWEAREYLTCDQEFSS